MRIDPYEFAVSLPAFVLVALLVAVIAAGLMIGY